MSHLNRRVLLISILTFSPIAIADNQESKVKVGFIYNFIKLTAPVKSIADSYHLCMAGNSSLDKDLIYLNQKMAHGKPIEVIRVSLTSSTLTGCDSLFIGKIAKKRQLITLIDHAISQKILTISEAGHSLDKRVIIDLKQLAGKVRFDINLATAQQSDIALNANLLRLAHNVLQ